MLKTFKVRNYKNFKGELVLNFGEVGGYKFSQDCITDNVISKMIIYGKNATGKTNLGEALLDITTNFRDMIFWGNIDYSYVNADTTDKEVDFFYEFVLGGKRLIYEYSKYAQDIMKEEKLFIEEECVFEVNFDKKEVVINHLALVDAESVIISKYIDALQNQNEEIGMRTLPFIRWLIANTALEADNILLKLSDYVSRMTIISVGSFTNFRRFHYDKFFQLLAENHQLNDFEDFLNKMGIECELYLEENLDGTYLLYFKHEIGRAHV